MNTLIQNILVITALGLALLFLVRKFFWKKPAKSNSASCGTDDCGCH
ncbi:MAG: FeoB-associated Cys-rich membrane protein [Flavobacteriaceae bacterium]|nr:FeoB-associated Cys-rich membrane protein [Bacteroidia bacterium]NND09924.1 FeoB-associated Cys-rich membrane protein [Flavobacteriaceae bacterium]NNL61111.1 FeoB-associated Cys-rich membrane protein [Flavobacteriaceae bacterium]